MTGDPVSTLRDGRAVAVRAATDADGPAIADLYRSLSPSSVRTRFVGGIPGPAVIRRFAALDGLGDGARARAVVAVPVGGPTEALVGEALVGEARYAPTGEGPDGDGVAEVSVTVRDDYQGQGLGRLLLTSLVGQARAEGLRRLRAEVLVTNPAMLHLLAPYGSVLTEATAEGTIHLEISTLGGVAGWEERPDDRPGRRRVLVEGGSWYDDVAVAALRATGDDVRRCLGPRHEAGWSCPLLTAEGCRLADGADSIIAKLTQDDPDARAIVDAHRSRWPDRLVD